MFGEEVVENNKAPKLELTHHTIKQPIDKPGSVVDDHLSSLQIALQIERLAIATSGSLIRGYLLAANRVYLRGMSPCSAVSSYLTPFTLTPLLRALLRTSIGVAERYRFCGTFPRVTPGRR